MEQGAAKMRMCLGILERGPLPSARMGLDQKHALEAHWRKWVFLSFGIDRLVR